VKRLSLVVLLATALPASAAPFDVTDAWFRALPGKLPAAGYFAAQNNTGREITITGAQSGACGMLMIHQSSNTGGMSGMTMLQQVKLPPGGIAKFAPGGTHLMCEGARMKPGDKVPVTLYLSSGAVTVAFQVRNATGK
jgi:copper(I)-binding protein